MELLQYLELVVRGDNLTAGQAQEAMQCVLEGKATTAQIAAFLVALRMKGETAAELVGFARAMRNAAARVPISQHQEPLLDTCGTGGDGAGTLNVSTIAALVAAGAGVRVAKHGNRSISSQCGSADLMEALGVNIELGPEQIARCIDEVGIGFLFAPRIHTATRHAQPARAELRMRTVFNLLGPLTNPAGATAQLVGAPSLKAAALMAEALAELGLKRGFVVHGSDGLDEITTTGPTTVIEIREGRVSRFEVAPEDFGVPRARKEDLQCAGKEENRQAALSVLGGSRGPRRDLVLVNAAAALVLAQKARDLREGMQLAAESIDSGAALAKLHELARKTQELGAAGDGR